MDLKKISGFWGSAENTIQRYDSGFHWCEALQVQEMINKKISGDEKIDMFRYFIDKYLKEDRKYVGISLGCGTGYVERILQQNQLFSSLEAIDISEGAVSQAKDAADSAGLNISYRIADINSVVLGKDKYDLVMINSSLHHVSDIEHLLEEVNSALKKDGLIFVSEYVGPSQFQFTNKQLSIINELLEILPPVYRKSVTQGTIKPAVIAPTIEAMNASDPSEAIRSSEIRELLHKYFRVIEKVDFGGTILQMLLQDIAGNFNPEDEKDRTVLNLLMYVEDVLIREGILESDFLFMVCSKKE